MVAVTASVTVAVAVVVVVGVAVGVGVVVAVAVAVVVVVAVGVAVAVGVGVGMKSTGPNETEISRAIQQALGYMADVLVWRNNTGKLQDRNGRWITYGLGVGGADLVGEVSVYVYFNQNDAESGRRVTIARFFSLEIKVPGKKPTSEQLAWHAVVRKMGGFCAVVSSAQDAIEAVDRCRRGEYR